MNLKSPLLFALFILPTICSTAAPCRSQILPGASYFIQNPNYIPFPPGGIKALAQLLGLDLGRWDGVILEADQPLSQQEEDITRMLNQFAKCTVS